MPVKKAKTTPKKSQKIETMTQAEFIASVAKSQGVTKNTVYEAIKLFKAGIVETLKQKKAVRFNEFANFGLLYQNERKCRNPRTGEDITVPARYRVKIKPSDVLSNMFKPTK